MKTEDKIEQELFRFRERYRQLDRYLDANYQVLSWHTKNEVLFSSGAMRIRRFSGSSTDSRPLLIVYSHVNAPNVIDFSQQHSLVQRLLENGQDVYLLDWGEIANDAKDNDLSVYIRDYIDTAVNYIREQSSQSRINMLGICQGGTFALCYTSMMPEKINRLATLVTPVDFHAGNSTLVNWTKYVDFVQLEKKPKNIPGYVITGLFQMIRPFRDLLRQVELVNQFSETSDTKLFMLMDQWLFHCPDQPGKAFAQFMRLFYQENRLVNGNLKIADTKVNLALITAPVLNVYAAGDHLVPATSSSALKDHIVGAEYDELVFQGGHIGLLVSKKAQETLLPEIGVWFAGPR